MDKNIALILDNGSIHKSKKVKAFLKKHEWIEIYYLPPYSPEFNPIERFWLWLKQKIYGCKSYKSAKGLVAQIRKLVWHFHYGDLPSKIQFEFQAYKELL